MTQLDLGALLNVTDVTVSNFERGVRNPDPDMLVRISNIFNVSIDYLLKDDDGIAKPEPAAKQIDGRLAETLLLTDEPWSDDEIKSLVHYIDAMKALREVRRLN